MLALQTAESDALAQPGQGSRLRVLVKDSGGNWRDLRDLEGEDFLVSVQTQEHADERFAAATFEVRREVNRLSLAPLMTTSKLNNYSVAGAALLKPGREVVVEAATVATGTEPGPSDWREIFRGQIFRSEYAGDVMKVDAFDLGHRLQRLFIETEREYSGPAEDVMQQIIDHAHGEPFRGGAHYDLGERVIPDDEPRSGYWYEVTDFVSGTDTDAEPAWPTTVGATVTSFNVVFTCAGEIPTLEVPVSPLFTIQTYTQRREPVWEALEEIARQFGWELRYRWDSTAGEFLLTLRNPNRSKATVDFTWYPDTKSAAGTPVPSYLAIDEVSDGWEDVRNVIEVTYSDPADLDETDEPKRKTVTVEDTDSQDEFERRFFALAEDASSKIDTFAEAQTMANAILADLKDPLLSHVAVLPLFPFAQLGDRYTFKANRVHYSDDQTLAVISIEHVQRAGEAPYTRVGCRGTPVATVHGWLEVEGRTGVATPAPFATPGAPQNVTASEVVGGISISFDSPTTGPTPKEYEVHLSKTAAFAITSATLACVVQGDRAELGDLDNGDTYFVKVVARDDAGNRGDASTEVSFVPGYVQPKGLQPFVDFGSVVPNSDFESVTDYGSTVRPQRWYSNAQIAGSGADWGNGGIEVLTDELATKSGSRMLAFEANGAAVYSDWFVIHADEVLSLEVWAGSDTAAGVSIGDVTVLTAPEPDDDAIDVTHGATIYGTGALGTLKPNFLTFTGGDRFARVKISRSDASNPMHVDHLLIHRSARTRAQSPTLLNSWVNNGGSDAPARYWRDGDGVVHLEGMIRDGSVAAVVMTLPVGYRPQVNRTFVVYSHNGSAQVLGSVSVETDGDVIVLSGNNFLVSLDGVAFRAED